MYADHVRFDPCHPSRPASAGPETMLGEMVKVRLHIPQPVRLQNISELTENAREQTTAEWN